MSLRQPLAQGSIGTPTPKFHLAQSSVVTMNSLQFTAMCWAFHTGGTVDGYQDIICLRDSSIGGSNSDDQIIGLVTHVPGSVRVMSLGDVDSDFDSTQAIPDNEWHHFTLVGETLPIGGSRFHTRLIGYLDGVEGCRSDEVSIDAPFFSDDDCYFVLFNSRSSDTDTGAVWIGEMAGLKIWSDVALTPDEIQREMWSYMPVRRNAFAVAPMINKAGAGYNYGFGPDFTVQGADFTDGIFDPPGVSWDAPMARRNSSLFYAPNLAALTGTALAGISETDIVTGGKTIIATLTGDTFIAN